MEPQPNSDTAAAQGLPIAIDLKDGEEVLGTFKPDLRLFLRRLAVISIATAVLFVAFPGLPFDLTQRVLAAVALLLCWGVAFDDWREWFDRRHDLWILTNHRLIFHNPDELDSFAWTELREIQKVTRFFWWGLKVKTGDGKTTIVRYAGPLKPFQAELAAAVARQTDG